MQGVVLFNTVLNRNLCDVFHRDARLQGFILPIRDGAITFRELILIRKDAVRIRHRNEVGIKQFHIDVISTVLSVRQIRSKQDHGKETNHCSCRTYRKYDALRRWPDMRLRAGLPRAHPVCKIIEITFRHTERLFFHPRTDLNDIILDTENHKS